ncbi:MAG: alkaline phosphatase [Deltaproteobacteria bacterium]|nr:alkaline phosphatase [Deltaproteobacteria bacterium]
MKQSHTRIMNTLGRLFAIWVLFLVACSPNQPPTPTAAAAPQSTASIEPLPSPATVSAQNARAKYVFLFIGDGMGYAQIQLADMYKQSTAVSSSRASLSFSQFPTQGRVTTRSANSAVTDSAAAGTALATGRKTDNGVLGKDPTLKRNFESVSAAAERAGMKIGIISSVSINHATPAAFYAHQGSRNSYYSIALQLGTSRFDYFGGGGFNQPRGTTKTQKSAYDVAVEHGYTHISDIATFRALKPSDKKIFATYPNLLNAGEMPWSIDQPQMQPSLADFTAKGIDLLKNREHGFFMMVEGGKIDWSCHDNDAATTIHEVLAFDAAVRRALSFYESHKDDTLIVVTADHETGGLSMGNNTLPMTLQIDVLQYQRCSLATLEGKIQQALQQKASFDTVLGLIAENTGLGDEQKRLPLTDTELALLKQAYTAASSPNPEYGQTDIALPEKKKRRGMNLSTLAIDILNQKAGINWGTLMHSGIDVPVFAIGIGADQFQGPLDNTDIPKQLSRIMGLSQ